MKIRNMVASLVLALGFASGAVQAQSVGAGVTIAGAANLAGSTVSANLGSSATGSGVATTYVLGTGVSNQATVGTATSTAGVGVQRTPDALAVTTTATHFEQVNSVGQTVGNAPALVDGKLANASVGVAQTEVASGATATFNRVDLTGSIGLGGQLATQGITATQALQALGSL